MSFVTQLHCNTPYYS